MSDDRLSQRVRALADADPQGPPVKVNVSLDRAAEATSASDPHREVISKIEALSNTPVNFRSALGMATAVVPRHLLDALSAIDGVEHVDIDATATHAELID